MAEHLKPIIEALIFASPEPLPEKTLLKLLEGEPKEDVEAALALLKQDYERPGGLQLVEVAGGYQIVTRPELHEYVRRLFNERVSQKLSVQALETLAVIAYRQPVTAPEITEIRGTNASGVLNTLISRKLIKIVGRKAVVGRPFMYSTTREFLDKFGLNDISDLPKVEDLADVLGFDPPSLDTEPTATPLAFDFDESSDAGSMESGAVEETSTEETSTEEAGVEETDAEEASADDASVEEAVAEEASADDVSVEETTVEETNVEEGDDADRENLVRDGEPSS
jgi:segregation and condensation protein B